VINKDAVRLATIAAIALNCKINEESVFARKHYFYPDLPKGYQISQYEKPFATGGYISFIDGGIEHRVRIERINLEEDAGKSIHRPSQGDTGVDFNRCGVPLLEIVSAPEIRSPRQAYLYLLRLKQILEYTGVCSGNMELGNLRCDANVSVRKAGQAELGTKTEIKNLNSFRSVEKGLEFEIERQTRILEQGGKVRHETLLWDVKRQTSVPMRSKEEVHDYRYFPEPDLVPLRITRDCVESLGREIPELPSQKEKRYIEEFGLPEYDASLLVTSRALAHYFESTAEKLGDPKAASNWIMTEVLKVLNERSIAIEDFAVSPDDLVGLLKLVKSGKISGRIAKEVFAEMVESGEKAEEIVKRRNLGQISDPHQLRNIVKRVIAENPGPVEQYRKGKTKTFGYLVGQVMKATEGRANPRMVSEILKEELS